MTRQQCPPCHSLRWLSVVIIHYAGWNSSLRCRRGGDAGIEENRPRKRERIYDREYEHAYNHEHRYGCGYRCKRATSAVDRTHTFVTAAIIVSAASTDGVREREQPPIRGAVTLANAAEARRESFAKKC